MKNWKEIKGREFEEMTRRVPKNYVTRLDSFGQIIEAKKPKKVLGESDGGEYYYEKNGQEYLGILDPEGKVHDLRLFPGYIGPIIKDYISYMGDKGMVNLPELKREVIIREADFPFVKKEGVAKAYSGKKIDLKDRRVMVIVDSKLSDAEKIATFYHEHVHTRGISHEKETQLETIHGLREMMKSYPGLIKNEKEWGKYFASQNNPDLLDEIGAGKIRQAVNYAIGVRPSFDVSFGDIKRKLKSARRGNLEKKVLAISISSLLISFLFINKNILGYVILEKLPNPNLFVLIPFGIGILSYIFFEILIKNKK
jgi:hypothetical protein